MFYFYRKFTDINYNRGFITIMKIQIGDIKLCSNDKPDYCIVKVMYKFGSDWRISVLKSTCKACIGYECSVIEENLKEPTTEDLLLL